MRRIHYSSWNGRRRFGGHPVPRKSSSLCRSWLKELCPWVLIWKNEAVSAVPCPRCGEQETARHLIFHCNFAKEVGTEALLHRMLAFDQFQTLKEALIAGMK
ncbi:hypothetical protein Bca101_032783 [Brassica carinata]